MVEEGDRLLIATSGGVDSSAMARVLAEKQPRLPVSYELVGCHIVTDLYLRSAEGERWLDRFYADLGVPLVRRDVAVVARLDPEKEMSCFFCAMQRRKALLAVAAEQGCNKIAYGHHLDDIIETLLINMFYNAEISTMPARLELDEHDVVVVRPLAMVKEHEVKRYARRMGIAEAGHRCPYGDSGRRARVKRLIAELAEEDGRVRDNLAASLGRVKEGYLLQKLRDVPAAGTSNK
jgi:tRNA(Ile)-lysidine synthase TilS/MesJ